MELLFFTRGIKHEVEALTKYLETQAYSLPRKNVKTGMHDCPAIQGNLKPYQLWGYTFPKAYRDEVLNTIRPSTHFTGAQKNMNKYIAMLRKVFGAEPIPMSDPKVPGRVHFLSQNVQKIGIGLMEDPTKVIGGFEVESV